MLGRTIPPESAFGDGPYSGPLFTRRREVLRETVAAFAIYDAGYGPDNFTPFVREFDTAAEAGAVE